MEVYFSQVGSLIGGVIEFEKCLATIHKEYNKGTMPEWPLVLLSTITLTTVVSLTKLLPDSIESKNAIDKRSIASLVRNLADTHDVVDFLLSCSTPEEYNLHRDILGYYLAGRSQAVQNSIFGRSQDYLKHTKEFYWNSICSKLTKDQQSRIKSTESIFYYTRTERMERATGKHSTFVMGILADLSTYVHSIPPGLWFADIAEGFDNTPHNREYLAVWIQICNYYFARTIKIIAQEANVELSAKGHLYLKHHENLFSKESLNC